ncbi:MAG: ferritin family protein [Phycisphaerae bacterium]|nr:ferritin family protein [Phycisphaerae bacterium]
MPDLAAGNQVLELAIRMEEIARDFYEALGLGSDDPKVREFCLEASRQEASHRATFQSMREQWSRSHQAHLTSPQALEAVAALAKQQTLPDPDKVREVAMGGNLGGALKVAVEMEQASIRFYEDMGRNLPSLAEALGSILAQERTHVSKLQAIAGTVGAAGRK